MTKDTERIVKTEAEIQDLKANIIEIKESIKQQGTDLRVFFADIRKEFSERYASKTKQEMLEKVVFGGIGLILTTFSLALINIVIKN